MIYFENMREEIIQQNHVYWQNRASGYSEVNKEELSGVQRETWTSFLTAEIDGQFPDRDRKEIKILDVGAGPGFISIILTEAGYDVTAFDFSESMLAEAKSNAKDLADVITFIQGDAMNLPFKDKSFDVVFSRNLTWNLPDPKKAYRQWVRVLKPCGLMMVFDANWYTYLVDEAKKEEYNQDRMNVAEEGLGDYNIGDNFDQMEDIARTMPMTEIIRPAWDQEFLQSLKAGRVSIKENVGEILYSQKEKINYKSTPLFMVKLVRE